MAHYICGVDLSGPANPNDTAAVAFELRDGTLTPAGTELLGASDSQVCEYVDSLL